MVSHLPILSVANRLRPIQKAAAGSLVSSLAGQAALVVSGVLVARMLGVENRGYLALLILWPTILARLGGIGLPMAIPYYLGRSVGGARALASTLIAPAAVQTTAMVTIHVAILLALLPSRPHAVQVAGVLTLISVPSSLALEYSLSFLQGQGRYFAFNLLRSLQPCLYAVAIVIVYLIGLDNIVLITSVLMLTSVVCAAATLVVALMGLPRTLFVDPSPIPLKDMVGFGLRGFLGSVSPVETFRLDQAVVGLFLTPAALGLYVVGLAFTNLPRFIAQSVGMVAYPHIAGEPDARLRRSSMLGFFAFAMALSVPAVLVLVISANTVVPWLFGRQFADAAAITRILLVGALFLSARRVLTDGARGAGAPGAGTIAEIASWLWLVPAVVVLAPHWGVVGVALAFATSSVFSLIVLTVTLMASKVFDSEAPGRIEMPSQTVVSR